MFTTAEPLDGFLAALTPGECMFIERRRRGLSKAAVAQELGVSVDLYCGAEMDRVRLPIELATFSVHDLTLGERCTLIRRRKDLPQKVVALDIQLSQWYVSKMELGLASPERLVAYWTAHLASESTP